MTFKCFPERPFAACAPTRLTKMAQKDTKSEANNDPKETSWHVQKVCYSLCGNTSAPLEQSGTECFIEVVPRSSLENSQNAFVWLFYRLGSSDGNRFAFMGLSVFGYFLRCFSPESRRRTNLQGGGLGSCPAGEGDSLSGTSPERVSNGVEHHTPCAGLRPSVANRCTTPGLPPHPRIMPVRQTKMFSHVCRSWTRSCTILLIYWGAKLIILGCWGTWQLSPGCSGNARAWPIWCLSIFDHFGDDS